MNLTRSAKQGSFPNTRWTLIKAIQSGDATDAARAMEQVCQTYWYPIYAFLRRNNHSPHDAEDFTQALFAQLIEDETLQKATQEAGKLRSLLLAALKRLISDQIRHRDAVKRGGGIKHLSFDDMTAEQRYASEPQDTQDPEWIYSHAWAHALLASTRAKLRAAYDQKSRKGSFDLLLPFLTLDDNPPPHSDIAAKLGTSQAAASLTIHRIRTKFRDLLREAVAETVRTHDEVAGEMAWLQSTLAQRSPPP
jgi:RNA polymerase sigma-70 factor (ECF subfamily)